MINFIIAFLGWNLYLFVDAYQDVDHQKNYGYFSHKTNFLCRLAVGIIIIAMLTPQTPSWWLLFFFGNWLVWWAWFAFDIYHNKLSGKAYNYVGSSSIDKAFKKAYPDNYTKVMMGVKLFCLIVSILPIITYLL